MKTDMNVKFPDFSGTRCLMMPYIQGNFASVPDAYAHYRTIIETVYLCKGDIGFLTIDESIAVAGKPHRGARARHGRALHTEAGIDQYSCYCWATPYWGGRTKVTLNRDVRILLANNLDYSCAVWDVEHEDTSDDGDIGHVADHYPYDTATLMRAGDVHNIGIFTPHESLPVSSTIKRQFLRIVSSGVHGREDYFTRNPLMPLT